MHSGLNQELHLHIRFYFSGPLMYKTQNNVHVLIGVVSYGPHGCVDSTLPNVYARVTEVLDWIFTYIKTSKTCLQINVEQSLEPLIYKAD